MQRNYFLATVLVFMISMEVGASLTHQCGTYKIIGTIKEVKNNYELVLFKDSLSEGHLEILNPHIALGFRNKKVSMTALVEEGLKYNKGKIKIESIEEVMPNFRAQYEGDILDIFAIWQ